MDIQIKLFKTNTEANDCQKSDKKAQNIELANIPDKEVKLNSDKERKMLSDKKIEERTIRERRTRD